MVERENDQQAPEELPASVTHKLPEEEWELEPAEFTKEKALDFIHQVQESPTDYIAHFEIDLEKAGVLSELEEKGVLPSKDPMKDPESRSDDLDDEVVITQREEVLKNLYIGTILGHLFDNLFSKK
jgi:hypothetical protein